MRYLRLYSLDQWEINACGTIGSTVATLVDVSMGGNPVKMVLRHSCKISVEGAYKPRVAFLVQDIV